MNDVDFINGSIPCLAFFCYCKGGKKSENFIKSKGAVVIAQRERMKHTMEKKMTVVYFVRHAQSEYLWEDDRSRPLTEEGRIDAKMVWDFFKDREIEVFYSSPYRRCLDTIAETADFYGRDILTDERLREREAGIHGNEHGMFARRWADHDYHEDDGESIRMVQRRNIEALTEILSQNKGKRIVIGTHGTALSTILNYYEPEFGCKDFLRIIDWMPYVLELDFEGQRLAAKKEHCYIEKEFGNK